MIDIELESFSIGCTYFLADGLRLVRVLGFMEENDCAHDFLRLMLPGRGFAFVLGCPSDDGGPPIMVLSLLRECR